MVLEALIRKMIAYDKGDAVRIQHFLKVHEFARTIAVLEGVSDEKRFILEAAAIVHDIGIHLCEEKYGNCNGKLQEKEGPALAEAMLRELGFAQAVISRVSFLVGHHHTYTNIDDIDYQILIEADFLVNLFEDSISAEQIKITRERIFKTKTGTAICTEMFDL